MVQPAAKHWHVDMRLSKRIIKNNLEWCTLGLIRHVSWSATAGQQHILGGKLKFKFDTPDLRNNCGRKSMEKHLPRSFWGTEYILATQWWSVLGSWIWRAVAIWDEGLCTSMTTLCAIKSDARFCLRILCEFHWPIGHTTTTAAVQQGREENA